MKLLLIITCVAISGISGFELGKEDSEFSVSFSIIGFSLSIYILNDLVRGL
jgi:hypothetical protein